MCHVFNLFYHFSVCCKHHLPTKCLADTDRFTGLIVETEIGVGVRYGMLRYHTPIPILKAQVWIHWPLPPHYSPWRWRIHLADNYSQTQCIYCKFNQFYTITLQHVSDITTIVKQNLYKNVQWKVNFNSILDFKLLPCSECCILSFGWFPGVWIYVPTFQNTLSVPSS